MQVPERLALIGGSILLSSTLIFTLKGYASQVIPNVGHSVSNVYSHIDDTRKDEFNANLKQAQQDNRPTGTLGTAQYYIDKNDNLYIGSGNLDTTIYNSLGSSTAGHLKSINLTDSIRPPDNSCGLFAQLPNITHINGLRNLDTSNVWDMTWMFNQDSSLQNLDLGNWNIHKNTNMWDVFNGDSNLRSVDITSFHDAFFMGGMFNNNGLTQVTVGKDTNLWGGQGLQSRGKWEAPNGYVGDYPSGGNTAGTWTLQ